MMIDERKSLEYEVARHRSKPSLAERAVEIVQRESGVGDGRIMFPVVSPAWLSNDGSSVWLPVGRKLSAFSIRGGALVRDRIDPDEDARRASVVGLVLEPWD